jgi:DnaJ-class molecular chaperone
MSEINKAFRKLSLKAHPDRFVGGRAEAEVALSKIAEAYEVLSNPARRAIYDQYGERGLKEGVPDGKGSLSGGKYRFNNNAMEIFANFFGTSSPFADILGKVGDDAPPEFYGELTGMQLPFSKQKAPPVQATVEVTLAEVYNGAQKTVSYARKKLGDGGVTSVEKVETQLYVEPGWEEGLVATLEDLGDQGVHVLPGDVDIYMTIAPDPLWSRSGTSLFFKHELTLTEALTGKLVDVPTFDNRTLSIPVTKVTRREELPSRAQLGRREASSCCHQMPAARRTPLTRVAPREMRVMRQVVSPGDSQTVPGEGICGGDLVICFDILFPKTLTPAQKKAIKAVDM